MTSVTLADAPAAPGVRGDDPDPAEYRARNAADIEWLRAAFDDARRRGSAAVMVIWQADPGWDASDGTRAPLRDPRTLVETDGQPDGFQRPAERPA